MLKSFTTNATTTMVTTVVPSLRSFLMSSCWSIVGCMVQCLQHCLLVFAQQCCQAWFAPCLVIFVPLCHFSGRGAVRCAVILMRIVTPLPIVELRCITLAGIIVCWLAPYCVLLFGPVPLVMPKPVSCHMSNIPASVNSASCRTLYRSTNPQEAFVAHGNCASLRSHHVH